MVRKEWDLQLRNHPYTAVHRTPRDLASPPVGAVRVSPGLRLVAEHEEHQGYHHGQQEPLGVQPSAIAAAAAVVVTVAAHTAARSRSHGVTPQTVVDLLLNLIRDMPVRVASTMEKGGGQIDD